MSYLLSGVRGVGDGVAGGGAAGGLRHHIRTLPRLRAAASRRTRHILILQVSQKVTLRSLRSVGGH